MKARCNVLGDSSSGNRLNGVKTIRFLPCVRERACAVIAQVRRTRHSTYATHARPIVCVHAHAHTHAGKKVLANERIGRTGEEYLRKFLYSEK
ncbi:hypothetical protein POVWA1_002410 [Plasmodium ovale wallikeri]|uniref:Uncharacterized protein n=1 Tax=Plasmodium ovale wallikeri TaxID=864142 RepID=A0A1A8YH50_PLAOA|nr:hypothetical protein POVWA1_002410 [Plasmodium ovale wallikeri]